MSREAIQQLVSFAAHSDLSAKQFYAVAFQSTGDVDIATAGKNMTGVLQDKPIAGKAGAVCIAGMTKVAISASTAITAGQLLEIDSGGTFIPHASGTVVAMALESLSSTAAVMVVSALLLPSNAAFS